ncbi:Ecp2 effector protein, partial [Immersiella caudata]
PLGRNRCGDCFLDGKASDASPSVSDCQKIIRSIEGDGHAEWTRRITGQREILSFGSCQFGIESTGKVGSAVKFGVGGQDVIDIVNEAITKFGGCGKVDASGVMPCV